MCFFLGKPVNYKTKRLSFNFRRRESKNNKKII
jgi:hypothetical protein